MTRTTVKSGNESKVIDKALEGIFPLLPGVEVTLNGSKLVAPSAPMVLWLDLLDANEQAAAGEITESARLRVLMRVLQITLRRNYPSLPDDWFAQLDVADYTRLTTAVVEAIKQGEAEAASR